jgi:hypothetical protein
MVMTLEFHVQGGDILNKRVFVVDFIVMRLVVPEDVLISDIGLRVSSRLSQTTSVCLRGR